MSRFAVLVLLVVVVAIIVGYGCSNPEAEISDLLDLRARAISEKDVKLLENCLARDYKEPLEIMRKHFEFWEAIEMRILDRSIIVESPNRAVAFQKYQFRVKSDGKWDVLEPAVERLVITREGKFFKKWKISGGLLPKENSAG